MVRDASVDFKNTVIIMTSNLGTKDISRRPVGFTKGDDRVELRAHEAQGRRGAEEALPPEFLNRIDDTIVFHELTRTRSPRSSTS